MQTWEERLSSTLADVHRLAPPAFVEAVAALAFEATQEHGDAWFDANPRWPGVAAEATRLYYGYIVDNESQDIARLMGQPHAPGTPFRAMVSEKGRTAYDRVADMFEHVDFARCRRMAMDGCGQLPVTALHVMDRTDVPELVLLDVSPRAIESVEALRDRFGWHRLQPRLADGAAFDFAGADVVYVANMVHGKAATVRRALASAAPDAQFVVREPYSLGRLWAERAELELTDVLEVDGRGPVSRHLSRDLYVRRCRQA